MNLERVYERWEKKVEARGRRKGEAEAVLAILEGRGLALTAAQRHLVLTCRDHTQLDLWLRGALTGSITSLLLSGTAAPSKPRAKRT